MFMEKRVFKRKDSKGEDRILIPNFRKVWLGFLTEEKMLVKPLFIYGASRGVFQTCLLVGMRNALLLRENWKPWSEGARLV